ncbi:MAG TPA: Gfo/Idh/MocA family oxidoreductase [Armatimonadota bacterium]|jgi:predicted dehydrogenase
MPNRLDRREFLRRTTAAGVLSALPAVWPGGAAAKPSRSPNEKLNIAKIACGGMGAEDLNQISSESIVALCDVDETIMDKAAQQWPKARKYVDFRRMLDREEKNIDAVVVSTPDHTHAVASLHALRMDKHLYCQKPLARTVREVRAMTLAARRHGVTTQMGTQAHYSPGHQRLAELIQSGAIGPVREVHVWSDRPAGWWPQGVEPPTESQPVPPNLHWDLWLGPAKSRPYNPAYMPFVWRGWWDFGTGALGDMGCHLMDPAYNSLKLRYPTSVEAEGAPRVKHSPPLWAVIRYEFPRRGDMPELSLTWYDGGRRPHRDLFPKGQNTKAGNGSLYIGDKGKLLIEEEEGNLVTFGQFEGPDPVRHRPPGHWKQWIESSKTGAPTGSNFDYAGPLAESVLLGNVALRTGRKLEWDGADMRATNCPEAEEFLEPHYRKGWSL